MASQDVLSLSLDDIIKMKSRKRGASTGWGRGQGPAGKQEPNFTRGGRPGRGWGRGRGRGRGPRFLATRFAVQHASSWAAGRGMSVARSRGNRGAAALLGQGRRRGGIQRGRSRGIRSGRDGRGSTQEERGKGVQTGRGRGSLRGLVSMNLLRRGRGGISQRGSFRQQQLFRQENQQHITPWDSSFRQKLARRKIQQARKTLVMSQQNNRAKDRLGIISARRGLQEEAQPVRGSGSVVSLSTQHGLTVSIKNNIASNQTQHAGSAVRSRPRLNRSRIRQQSAASYTPAMFTVLNDQAMPYEPPPPAPPAPRKILNRNITSSREPRAGMAPSVVAYPQQNLRPTPEPHRQVLDPKVQKEIAMLQGKEVSLNNGPGPGVKGFRHIPSHTARSLNERFTEERMITS